jgi:hypothetical protein
MNTNMQGKLHSLFRTCHERFELKKARQYCDIIRIAMDTRKISGNTELKTLQTDDDIGPILNEIFGDSEDKPTKLDELLEDVEKLQTQFTKMCAILLDITSKIKEIKNDVTVLRK